MNFGVISSRSNSNRSDKSGICEDADYLTACLDKVLLSFDSDDKQVTFVSGGGRGPENFVIGYAEARNYQSTVIPPRTRARGPLAFPERNTSIVSVSDVLIVFWGGEDMYIASALSEAMFMQKPVMVFPI